MARTLSTQLTPRPGSKRGRFLLGFTLVATNIIAGTLALACLSYGIHLRLSARPHTTVRYLPPREWQRETVTFDGTDQVDTCDRY